MSSNVAQPKEAAKAGRQGMAVFDPTTYYDDMARQQQQQQQPKAPPPFYGGGGSSVLIEAVFRVPDDQLSLVPRRARAPAQLPVAAIPRKDEFVYLAPRSSWLVKDVVNVWVHALHVRIEVWLEHYHSGDRPTGFGPTQ